MMKKTTISCLMSILIIACQGQNKEVNMEKLIQEKLALTQQYDHRPLFGAQLNKTACKMIVEVEGGIDYRLTDNTGESIMLPLNVLILKKGKQRLKIKIYPRDGERYLTKYATASVVLYRSPDKDASMEDYEELGSFELPIDIEEKQLPYYEAFIDFDADVPYDYQKELDAARDLSEIEDIEKRVVEKYADLRTLCVNIDENNYLFEHLHWSGIFHNTLYAIDYKDVEEASKNKRAVVDNHHSISDRQFLPIENYIMQFYANGKIVALWQKNLLPMLYLKATIEKSTPDERKLEIGDPIFLYMPEGSNELKIW